MARTHYDTLGIKRGASSQEIKSAYRKIVLKHHPDRSNDPTSKAIFLNATEAYNVLIDAEKRRNYDLGLDATEKHRRDAEEAARRPQPPKTHTTRRPTSPIGIDLSRLTLHYNRGQYAEAEKLAQSILSRDPRQAIPYAVLGDIARSRGHTNEAQRYFALAIQMDPRNPIYQRRYEQLLASSHVTSNGRRDRLESEQAVPTLPMIAAGVTVAGAVYVAASTEAAVLSSIGLVSTWTLGLLILLFLCGVVAGACLSVGNLIDRFEIATTTATGRSGPTVVLGLIAIVNFWAAVLIYVLIGLVQKAFNFSTTRVVAATGAVVVLLALGSQIGGAIDPRQVFLWGGNLTYLGTLVGWLVADAFRGAA